MAPSTTPLQSPQDTIDIDRCGALLAEKAQSDADPKWKELAALKTKMQGLAKSVPADEPKRFTGATHYVDLTQREMKREIISKMKAFNALRKAIGIVKLVKTITISFKLLDAEIGLSEQVEYVTSTRTGPRDVSGGLIVPVAA